MKKTVPFEIFGPNQYLMFDIGRLAELEQALGHSIIDVAVKQDIGVNFCLTALPIAMKQHYRPDRNLFANKIEEFIENGGSISDITVPLVKAIAATGIFGKIEAADDETDKSEPPKRKNGKKETE